MQKLKYIWLNPVVKLQYKDSELDRYLKSKGYIEVFPKKDYIKLVKDKYREILEKTEKTICDMRCPKAVDLYKESEKDFYYPDIEPILIHIAREFSEREDLRGFSILVITPCESLKFMGNQLAIKNVSFESWINFKKLINFKEGASKLEDSPIPMGFFDEIGVEVSKNTGEDLLKINEHAKIVEALYCYMGCHNGDGVIDDKVY